MNDVSVPLATAGHAYGLWGPFGILIWRDRVDPRVALAFRRATIANARQHPTGTAIIHVVEPTSAVPEAATRKVLAEIPDDVTRATRFVLVVAEGDGLRASLVRGVTTGVSMLMRAKLALKVFATVTEAARFSSDDFARAGIPFGSDRELADAVETVRARMPRS